MEWNKERIMSGPLGGRGLEEYEGQLGFNHKELEGKTVLDLGAGPTLKLDRELKDAGVNAHVVNFSPDFSLKRHGNIAHNNSPSSTIVAGVGQALPFADQSFDIILSLHVIEHLPSRADYITFCQEVVRVLKPGGKAYVGPALPEDARHYDMTFPKQDLKNADIVQVRHEQREEVRVYGDLGYSTGKEFSGRYILERQKEPEQTA